MVIRLCANADNIPYGIEQLLIFRAIASVESPIEKCVWYIIT